MREELTSITGVYEASHFSDLKNVKQNNIAPSWNDFTRFVILTESNQISNNAIQWKYFMVCYLRFFLFTIHSPTTLFSKQGCWTLPISPILLVNPIETPLRTSWLCKNAADFGKERERTLFVNFLWGNFHTKLLLTVMILTHATWHQNLALEISNVLIFFFVSYVQ